METEKKTFLGEGTETQKYKYGVDSLICILVIKEMKTRIYNPYNQRRLGQRNELGVKNTCISPERGK